MTGQLPVRRASAADIESVTSIVRLAFAHDPLWAHAMARPDGGTAHHGEFWRLFIEGTLRYPWTWLTSGGEATSSWIPPGGTEMTPEQEQRLADLATNRLGPTAGNYLELLSRFDAAHPRAEPHYYLSLLGTHPDHRGKAIGMRLLAHDLEQIDAQHLPAYLESSNPANNHRYASVGFQPHGEFCSPGGGPIVTTMWRSAR
ncbi:MAG TPA: GNAT family N-acetyltransferase [Streptosporangiaceae bacterium]|nr:GNAT family N-acetyltransferase [Streptosporangiaceae bacterium]